MKKSFLLLLLLLACAGCSPVREEMRAWQGAKLSELMAQVGPPSSVSSPVAGITYYNWLEDRGGVYTYGGPVSLNCVRTFGVDAKEMIVSFTWSGSCISSPDSKWHREQ